MRVILQTVRLTLREMTGEDLDFLAEMMGDADVMRFYPKQATRDETQAWIERQRHRYTEEGHGIWMVVDRATGVPVGRCGLAFQSVDGRREPEIGYMIHRPYWRRGFASEAAAAVRDWAFETKLFPYVISLVRPENLPSQAVARKVGMAPKRETIFAGLPHIVFSIGRDPGSIGSRPSGVTPD